MKDMPKLQCPFIRDQIDGKYVCTPKINEDCRWVFTDKSIAVDKLDGTNVSVVVEAGKITDIYNRKNEINIWKKGQCRFGRGILEAVDGGRFRPTSVSAGSHFGELIGEAIQGNPYNIVGYKWIPFSYMRDKLIYKFWFDFIKEIDGKSDEEIYTSVSDLFKGLWSLYKRKLAFKKTEVTEDTTFEGYAAEGIVFYNKDSSGEHYGECAKLRRDMFDWFKGNEHQTYRG